MIHGKVHKMKVDILQQMDVEKEEYLSHVRTHGKGKRIILYGAGRYGRKFKRLLEEQGIVVDGFVVTQMDGNEKSVCGLPVYPLDALLPDREHILFLVAVKGETQDRVAATLKAAGVQHALLPPVHIDEIISELFRHSIVEVTAKAGCSVRCRYCPQDLFLHQYFSIPRQAEMTFDDFCRYLSKLPEHVQIVFSGFVEPFLAKDGVRMVRYAHDSGHAVRLFTTLVGLNLASFHEIEDIPFQKVVLHLPDIHQYANIPVTDEYLELLYYIVEKKRQDGAPFVDTATCQAPPDPRVAEIIGKKIPVTWDLIDRAGNLPAGELQHQCVALRKNEDVYYCKRSWDLHHSVLLPNGDLVLCCMDFGMRHVLGNLNEQSYEEIMQGDVLKRIRNTLRKGAKGILCEKCTSLKRF